MAKKKTKRSSKKEKDNSLFGNIGRNTSAFAGDNSSSLGVISAFGEGNTSAFGMGAWEAPRGTKTKSKSAKRKSKRKAKE